MTLLVAMRASDGLAVVSDRKETYVDIPPKSVKKYYMDKKGRFYISLAGDGGLAEGVLNGLARARTGPSDVVGRIRSIAASIYAKTTQDYTRVDGFLVIAYRHNTKLYNIGIIDGHVDVLENHDAVSIQGDVHAQILCRYVTKKINFSHMPCEAVATRLHVLASDMAEQVESVGEHDAYGFDLVLFLTAGSTKLLEEYTERLGWIDICIRLKDHAGPFAVRGGISQ